MSDDRAIREAAERLYDRARSSGVGRDAARVLTERATADVARRVDDGRIVHPSSRAGRREE